MLTKKQQHQAELQSMKNELTVVTNPPPATVAAQPMESAESLLRFAIERGADVNAMERLMSMRREINAERAKASFDAARSQFQARCPIIGKSKAALDRGGRPMYHYAPIDAILEQTKSLREELGFSHSFSTDVTEGWVECTCALTHRDGHSESSKFKVPATSKSPMMNDPQMYASALTFLQRYTFCAVLGIATAMEDTDNQTNKPKPKSPMSATPEYRKRMIAKFEELGLTAKAHQFAIDKGLVMPDASLETWPLDDVPATKEQMETLIATIKRHQ